MGISLVVKDVDYSAIAIAFSKLDTSVTDGLLALYQLRSKKERVIINEANGESMAVFLGSPEITSSSVKATVNNTIDFGVQSPNSSRSIACIINTHTVAPFADWSYVGNRRTSSEGMGGDSLLAFQGKLLGYGMSYSNKTGDLLDQQQVVVTSTKIDNRDYELVIITLEDEVGITLYVPRINYKVFTAVEAGRYFSVNNPDTYQLAKGNSKGVVESSLFALWNRALPESDVLKFYADVKATLSDGGIDI